MLNTIEAYTDAATKQAIAANKKDQGAVDFHKRWISRALDLETAEDRVIARKAIDEAYKAARNVPRPSLY